MIENRIEKNGKNYILFTHWLPKENYYIIENLEKSYEKYKLEERYYIFQENGLFAFGFLEKYYEKVRK